jgi:hypothetical protein
VRSARRAGGERVSRPYARAPSRFAEPPADGELDAHTRLFARQDGRRALRDAAAVRRQRDPDDRSDDRALDARRDRDLHAAIGADEAGAGDTRADHAGAGDTRADHAGAGDTRADHAGADDTRADHAGADDGSGRFVAESLAAEPGACCHTRDPRGRVGGIMIAAAAAGPSALWYLTRATVRATPV